MKSREHSAISTFNGSYAFIKPDGADGDVFAHRSELPSEWKPKVCPKTLNREQRGRTRRNRGRAEYRLSVG